MKKFLIAAAVVLMLAGCTDAERARYGSYNEQSDVVCYSGGVVISEDVSTGKVLSLDGDGFSYRSAKDGKYVRSFADCILRVK